MRAHNLLTTSVLIIMCLVESHAYNILGVFPHVGKSHFDVFLPLMKALAQKGHTVTVISNFPLEKPLKNYKDIDIGGGSKAWVNIIDIEQVDPTSKLTKINNVVFLKHLSHISCDIGLSSRAVQNFLKTKDKYDLMITEFFNSDCFLSLAHRVKAPIIGLSSSTLMPWTSERFANPTHTAYIPNNCMDYSDKMTFYERLENTVITLYHQFFYEYFMLSQDERLVKKYISRKASQLKEIIMNSSLMLMNTHFSLNLPRPLVPNVIEVGGIHIGKTQPLPRILFSPVAKMTLRILFVLLSILMIVNCGIGLNILVIFPHPGKSHYLVFEPLLKTLAKKGHNLTVLSFCPQETPPPNYRDVSLVDSSSPWVEIIKISDFTGSRKEMYGGVLLLKMFAEESCSVGLQSKNFQEFLKEDNKFDLILAEFFNTNCFMGLVKKYKAPVIGLSSCVWPPWISDWFGNPENPSYIPTVFMDYSDEMTFLERVENTAVLLFDKLVFKLIDEHANMLSEKFVRVDLYEGQHVIYNASLLLSNTHFSLNRPKPLVPSIVEVGGIHITKHKKLPANLEKWINSSSEGVIYFSLGSMIKGKTFPNDKRQIFLNAFKRLPQRVLWKWEDETMEGKPDNVMVQKWMPQLDILCHPNVKAFISHGGLLGITEAVHCGVPTIVMPQFGDQHTNARALEASGGGVILQLNEATEEKVSKTLKKVLSPGFRQKAKELSERFRDRPLPPLETAIYWVEYVARHKGAPHMRTAAVDMPFYKYYLIDVMAFLLLVFSIFIYVSYRAVKFILRKALKRNNDKSKVKTS